VEVNWRALGEVMVIVGGFVVLGLLVGLSRCGSP